MGVPILAFQVRVSRIVVTVASTLPMFIPMETTIAQSLPDSQATVKHLHSMQARFERIRRNRLPVTFGSTGGSRCDAYVGRFCYWHDDRDWEAPEEHPQVSRERLRLLSQLDSAAARFPGDGWIAGQQIRYRVEIGQLSEALAITRGCRAPTWWCRALEGYVHHTRGEFAAADSTFSIALAAMSDERECEWRDVSFLLQGDSRDTYRHRECPGRRELEDRMWWLSDPLYLMPGNERRTEHYSRLVVNEMMLESAYPRTMPWGRDNRELLVRFGPTIGWERKSSSATSIGSTGSVVGYHRKDSWHFVPTADYLRDLSTIRVGEWDLEPDRPVERYGVAYSHEFAKLTHNLYVFRDRDSALVVAACVSPTPDETETVESGMVITADETSTPVTARGYQCQVMVAQVPIRPALVSIEAVSGSDSIAARSRYWLDIPAHLSGGDASDLSISDLMLLAPAHESPDRLELAIPLAMPSSSVTSGHEIGLYWEVYGLNRHSDSLQFSLSVDKIGKSFLRRAAEWAGFARPSNDLIQVKWTEPVLNMGTVKRGITLRLTEDMDGTYVIRLTATSATGKRVMATNVIEVVR